MKISEMNNDQAAEALIRLADPFGRLCEDEEAVKMINEYGHLIQIPRIQMFGKMLPRLVSFFLKTHKNDLYEVIGALTMQNRATVAKMQFVDTVKVLRESYDEVLRDFFTSSVQRAKEIAEKSSASL